MSHLVVMETRVAAGQVVWAWCVVGDSGVGFEHVTFMKPDGMTPAKMDSMPDLSGARTLFVLPDTTATAPARSTSPPTAPAGR